MTTSLWLAYGYHIEDGTGEGYMTQDLGSLDYYLDPIYDAWALEQKVDQKSKGTQQLVEHVDMEKVLYEKMGLRKARDAVLVGAVQKQRENRRGYFDTGRRFNVGMIGYDVGCAGGA